MADTKEVILTKLSTIRTQASKLKLLNFLAVGADPLVTVNFETGSGQTPLFHASTKAAADTLVTALNSALATYVASVKFAKTESDLAEAYKTAAGAETAVLPSDGE